VSFEVAEQFRDCGRRLIIDGGLIGRLRGLSKKSSQELHGLSVGQETLLNSITSVVIGIDEGV
jgi:hypothetical protein